MCVHCQRSLAHVSSVASFYFSHLFQLIHSRKRDMGQKRLSNTSFQPLFADPVNAVIKKNHAWIQLFRRHSLGRNKLRGNFRLDPRRTFDRQGNTQAIEKQPNCQDPRWKLHVVFTKSTFADVHYAPNSRNKFNNFYLSLEIAKLPNVVSLFVNLFYSNDVPTTISIKGDLQTQ